MDSRGYGPGGKRVGERDHLAYLPNLTRGTIVTFDVIPPDWSLRLLAVLGVIVRHVDDTGFVTVVPAHQILEVRDCKIVGCIWEAVDRTGRYANLCESHRRDKIREWQADREKAIAASRVSAAHVNADPATAAARDCARISAQLVRARRRVRRPAGEADIQVLELELKRAYVQLGRALGIIPERRPDLQAVA